MLNDGMLILTASNRLATREIEYAALLAECRTDTAGELWEVVGLSQELESLFPFALEKRVLPSELFVA
jgi:hypothetical protein